MSRVKLAGFIGSLNWTETMRPMNEVLATRGATVSFTVNDPLKATNNLPS